MKALDGKKFLHGGLVEPPLVPCLLPGFLPPLLPLLSFPSLLCPLFGAPLGLSGPARLLKILLVPPSGYLVVS